MAKRMNHLIKHGVNIGRANIRIGEYVPNLVRPTYGPIVRVRINSRVSLVGGGGINLRRDTSVGGGVQFNW